MNETNLYLLLADTRVYDEEEAVIERLQDGDNWLINATRLRGKKRLNRQRVALAKKSQVAK